jgi:penicillin G amidase
MTVRRALTLLLVLILIAIALLALGSYRALRSSLPLIDGEAALAGLGAPVDVPRDKFGVPTIIAATRLDAARSLGFIHAQERFFQMDLLRRNAAGELSELFGALALERDKKVRLHRLRARAEQVHAAQPERAQTLLEAYAAGVNQGLKALAGAPFEYRLLRVDPAPWTPADTWLASFSMFIDLTDELGARDRAVAQIEASLPPSAARWLLARGGSADAALDGSVLAPDPLPTADELDLRTLRSTLEPLLDRIELQSESQTVGSNNFAVGGALTDSGSAILANDMHLGLSVPPIWFRARLKFSDGTRPVDATGVTLPGAPLLVAGSNGALAWGYTNSYVDVTDLVALELSADGRAFKAADGTLRPLVVRRETIRIKGAASVEVEILESPFGPLLPAAPNEPRYAVRWTAHDPAAVNLRLEGLLTARDVRAGLKVCQGAGMPPQNALLADRGGHIGWTICGQVPVRSAVSGARPQTVTEATEAWRGFVASNDAAQIVDPDDARLWTANARALGRAPFGEGDYDSGERAGQIRDRLRERERFDEATLYAIQLDDEGRYLKRWQALLQATLTPAALAAHPELVALKRLSADSRLHAERDNVAYTLNRAFREQVTTALFRAPIALIRLRYPTFEDRYLRQREALTWQLLDARPPHLLDPRFNSFDALLLDAAVRTEQAVSARFGSLRAANWGAANSVRVRHPLSRAIPLLSPLLDMPTVLGEGDALMPRVQRGAFGASERMVVSPGREREGIFTLPGGQSGHPLSPYFRRGFLEWANAEPTPFLPLGTRYRLVLKPPASKS